MNNSVEDYYQRLELMDRELHLALHHWLRTNYPEIKRVCKYGSPFYVERKNLFYVHTNKSGTYIGFVNGAKMANQFPVLKGEEKVVRKFYIQRDVDLPVEEIRQLIDFARTLQ